MATRDAFDTLRQPEYTGENRCIPCTIVNVAIATAVAAVAFLVSPPIGTVAFAAFAVVIYLRGYLVPGTPTFTKRYLPDRILARFDKAPESTPGSPVHLDEDGDLDAEEVLVGVGALESTEDGSDLRLADPFHETWQTHVDRLRDDGAVRDAFAEFLGVGADRVSIDESGPSITAAVDGETVGRWESRVAFVADVAADRALVDRASDWSDLPAERRGHLLSSLRIFIDRCPDCDGRVVMREEVVESCCRSRATIAAECRNCGSRLFEVGSDQVTAAARSDPRQSR